MKAGSSMGQRQKLQSRQTMDRPLQCDVDAVTLSFLWRLLRVIKAFFYMLILPCFWDS